MSSIINLNHRKNIIRANNVNLTKAVEKALIGIEGYGGGHEKACGAGIKKEYFRQFLENLEKEAKTCLQ